MLRIRSIFCSHKMRQPQRRERLVRFRYGTADEGAVPATNDDCQKGNMTLAWIVLVGSGMLEAVWATSLEASKGFRKFWPSVLFVASLAVSMAGLTFAMREISVGTAYAVWVGIGAVLTAAWAMLSGAEKPKLVRILLLLGLIGCVVGLKLVS